jgi:hypothetical protein
LATTTRIFLVEVGMPGYYEDFLLIAVQLPMGRR